MSTHLRMAVAAGLLLLAGCGADVEGSWTGTWSTNDGTSGMLTLLLHQSGGEVSGNLAAAGSSCFGTATLTGDISGDKFTAAAKQSDLTMNLHGTVKDDKQIDGTFDVAPGSPCAGLNGTWNATKQP